MNTQPTGITANRSTRLLTVTWGDGHVSDYPFSLLRRACPCAECRGGHENMGGPPEPQWFTLPNEDTPATRLQQAEPVGAYGITLTWEDGHHYGIYNWYFLRILCPCSICRKEAIYGE